jgi:hypothetical protein
MYSAANNALTDEWYVTDGVVAEGPVPFHRLASDVARGRTSKRAFVRHGSWSIWQRFEQIGRLDEHDRRAQVRRLGEICAAADERARNPASAPSPPLSQRVRRRSTPPPSSMPATRPSLVNPVGVLSRAASFREALQLALSTALAASRADAGLAHGFHDDLEHFVTVHAIGDGAESQLGNRLACDDPSVVSARHGDTIVAEPEPGLAGRHVAGRFAPLLDEVVGAAMVPVLAFGRLHAMIEVARQDAPFCAREIARIEDIVEALSARGVVAGWLL